MTSAVADSPSGRTGRGRPRCSGRTGSPRRRPPPAGASASSAAAASYSSTVRPQIDATTRAPAASSGGRSCSSQASTPGPCSPTLLIIPPAGLVHPQRRVARPTGSAESDFTTTAPSDAEVDVGRQLGAVARRARRGHHRVGQHDRADPAWSGRRRPRAASTAPAAGGGRSRSMPRWNSCSVRTRSSWAARVDDAVGGRQPGGRGGEARDALHRRRGADVGAVGAGAAAPRAVDHEVDLAGGDELDGVGAGGLARPSPPGGDRDRRPRRGRRPCPAVAAIVKPGVDEAAGRLDADRLVPVGQRHEHAARRSGSRSPAASWLLANASPKVVSMPMTSPVLRISGPSTVSASGNRLNGSTASLTAT